MERVQYHKHWLSELNQSMELYKDQKPNFLKFNVEPEVIVEIHKEYQDAMDFMESNKHPHEQRLRGIHEEIGLAIVMGTHKRLGENLSFKFLK